MAARVIGWHDPSKRRTAEILGAFTDGCHGELRGSGKEFDAAPAAFFGVTPALVWVYDRIRAEGLDFYYIDNPYFGRGEFYRVTKNAKQHKGVGRGDPERFRRHGLAVEPWRRDGRHVLVTTQSEWWYELHGTTLAAWLESVVAQLREATDRPILVRYKPKARLLEVPNVYSAREVAQSDDERPLAADLADAWAVVTHSSNSAVEGLLAGVPAFCTSEDCAAATLGLRALSLIETPIYPEGREEWAAVLAANQWTLAEMRQGRCWRALHR